MAGFAHAFARGVYSDGFWILLIAIPPGRRQRRKTAAKNTRKFTRPVYRALTLFPGDVVFDGIGVLQAGEFDGEAVFDMTDHPAHGLADSYRGTHGRP